MVQKIHIFIGVLKNIESFALRMKQGRKWVYYFELFKRKQYSLEHIGVQIPFTSANEESWNSKIEKIWLKKFKVREASLN